VSKMMSGDAWWPRQPEEEISMAITPMCAWLWW